MKHSHYQKDISHLKTLDVYRTCQLFNVTDPAIQHAVKKLLCAGKRGTKSEAQDVQEAIDTLARYQAMQQEDSTPPAPAKPARAEELQADDGWIEWGGGECPVSKGTRVDIRYSSGIVKSARAASNYNWRHEYINSNVVAYRVAKDQS